MLFSQQRDKIAGDGLNQSEGVFLLKADSNFSQIKLYSLG